MSRPIGAHIREVCAIVEEIGPCLNREIARRIPEVGTMNCGKYARRAVRYGMLTTQGRPARYAAVDNWREIADSIPAPQARSTTKPIAPVSSVFEMGERIASGRPCWQARVPRKDFERAEA